MITRTDSSGPEQLFYGKEFCVGLKFLKNGGINGTLTHFPRSLKFRKQFDGLYSRETSKVRLTFLIEWSNVNLASKALTCFSGEIFNYRNESKCLVLEWLQINEGQTKIGSFMKRGREILIACSEKDINQEIEKVISRIPQRTFDERYHNMW